MDNTAEQLERLNSPVRRDGVGEDPVIQAVMSPQFAEATNSEAIEIALLLQQLIRGQNSMLSQQEKLNDELSRLRGRMDKFDQDEKKWNENREDFMKEINAKAESLRIEDPQKRAQLIAKEAQRVQAEIQNQLANASVYQMQFKAMLEAQPKEIIVSPGKLVTVNEAGVIQQKLEAEVIRIKNLSWVLQPGVPTEVPKLVADEFRSRQKVQAENRERKALLNANKPRDNMEVAQKWNEISHKYGTAADQFRADDR
ncbi:hypothetical protein IH575_00245 [Candidatus Dojkabacteria bacterium]|nr:hypothetical protein [Candidatus Dojkabacteria bacterium]